MYEQLTIDGEIAYAYKHNPYYFVTRSGKVYSVYVKSAQGRVDFEHPRLLAPSRDRYGYDRVIISDHGTKKYLHIHTIIAEQFIGSVYKTGLTVNHKDGNKLNNSADNLEIITSAENTRHAIELGLRRPKTPLRVLFNGEWYNFTDMASCTRRFPDLSRQYLFQLHNGVITQLATLLVFGEGHKVSIYRNGECIKTVDSYRDADRFIGCSLGMTSCRAHGSQEYAERVNKYHVEFEGVSTIEKAE